MTNALSWQQSNQQQLVPGNGEEEPYDLLNSVSPVGLQLICD